MRADSGERVWRCAAGSCVIATDPPVLDRGAALYASYCAFFHGVGVVSGGTVPDLRRLPAVFYDSFDAIVRGGLMDKAGMPRFDDALAADEVEAIRAYVIDKAHQGRELRAMPAWQRKLLEVWYEMKSWSIARFMAASSHSAASKENNAEGGLLKTPAVRCATFRPDLVYDSTFGH